MSNLKNLIYLILVSALLFTTSCEDDSSSNSSSTTLSGSYANMLTLGDYLYFVNDSELATFSIVDPALPVEIDRKDLGFGVESLFIRNDVLFIGSRTAMHIYRAGSDGIPNQISSTEYASFDDFCLNDPIVANDSIAYATLSTTLVMACERRSINELRLYNIKDLSAPVLMNTNEMIEPKGLGLDDHWLFVCEANDGLRVMDVSNPLDLREIHHFTGFRSYDVIPDHGLLMVVGPDSLYQFDYSDMDQMYQLSAIDL